MGIILELIALEILYVLHNIVELTRVLPTYVLRRRFSLDV